MDDWRRSSKNAWIDLYRAALDHYLTEYDRATDIHSALWQEVYTNPAPAGALPDPAPLNPTPALAFHQPATGVPLFKPFYTQPGRVQTASRDPVVQLLFNRDGSRRTKAARPVSSSVTVRRNQRQRAAAEARAEEAAKAKAEQDKRDIRPYQVAAANKAAVYREAIRRCDLLQILLSRAEASGDPTQIARAPGIRKELNRVLAEVEANSPADDFERDIFARTERVETFITAAGLLLGGRGAKSRGGLKVRGPKPETRSLIERANYAQRDYSMVFSKDGKFSRRRVSEVAEDLRTGVLTPDDVVVEIIVRHEGPLILTTRSAMALTRAGIPRSKWKVKNVTNDPKAQKRLDGQLRRNGLDGKGIPEVRETRSK